MGLVQCCQVSQCLSGSGTPMIGKRLVQWYCSDAGGRRDRQGSAARETVGKVACARGVVVEPLRH